MPAGRLLIASGVKLKRQGELHAISQKTWRSASILPKLKAIDWRNCGESKTNWPTGRVQTTAQIALPFYFMVAGGAAQSTVGLMMTPWPAVIMIIAPISGRLSDKYPAGLLCGVGLVILTASLGLMLNVPPTAELSGVAWRMALCGIGFGFFQSPNVRAIVSAAPRHRSGIAGGMMSTARLIGQTIGGAIVAAMFAITGKSKPIALALEPSRFSVTKCVLICKKAFLW